MNNINKDTSLINIIGMSLLIILMVVNQYISEKSTSIRLMVNISTIFLGVFIVIINIKAIIKK